MRITNRGVGLLVAAVALLAGGLGLGYPDLVVIATVAVVALGFAVGYAAWRPRLSVVRLTDPDRVMRGEASRVTLTVANGSRLRAATLVAYDRCGPDLVAVPLLRLRAGKETVVGYPVPTARRGVIGIGPLRVVRRDPLGLVTLPRSHGGVDRVWVYPRVHPLSAVPAGVVRSLDGLVDKVPHGSITFDTLREYVIGDELRHVHWRTSARVGELMVREHVDTSLPRLVVLLDDRVGAYPDGAGSLATGAACEAFEAACEAAASILVAASRDELPVALRLVGGVAVAEGRRGASLRPYLDALAEATLLAPPDDATAGAATAADPLAEAAARLRHHREGDTLIYLTGPGDAGDLGRIGTLRGRYPTIVVGLFGADGSGPPAPAGVLVVAARDGAEFAAAWDGVRAW